MNYYRRWIGSYKKKTADLSLVEHGVYTLLLDHYYATEKPLPAEVTRLSRICGAITHDEQRAVQHVADAFFPAATDGLRHNARADEELGIAQATIQKQREGGVETAEKRWGNGRSTDGDPDKSTKVAAHKSTKKKSRKSTDKPADKSTNGRGAKSTDALPIQPTTNNHQPTTVTRQPSPDRGATPPELGTARPAQADSPPVFEPRAATPERANGHDPEPGLYASDAEIPWWHSPAGITRQGAELGIAQGDDEAFSDYADRVMAAKGPGPWDGEVGPDRLARIAALRDMAGTKNARAEPAADPPAPQASGEWWSDDDEALVYFGGEIEFEQDGQRHIGVVVRAGESLDDYRLRCIAAAGPGVWRNRLTQEQLQRVQLYELDGVNPPKPVRPQPRPVGRPS